jgi:hypothetical protein
VLPVSVVLLLPLPVVELLSLSGPSLTWFCVELLLLTVLVRLSAPVMRVLCSVVLMLSLRLAVLASLNGPSLV